ncbi:hypothetical protein [Nocardia lijiangensis]|uniref:hypothetical protein n=1 Tax=Nocardia lijiangensis TaxID=299618 RepID=UPI0008347B5C|nr:hypothetical protein [Nocardia lijiangensis]
MPDDLVGQIRNWQQLKQQAITGEFSMDEGIGEALRKRCEDFRKALDLLKQDALLLDHLAGYGTLPSAQQLQKKFEQKAVGGAAHDANDSAVNRLDQHLEVVQLMQDTYAAAIGRLQETDQAAGNQLNAHTEGMN